MCCQYTEGGSIQLSFVGLQRAPKAVQRQSVKTESHIAWALVKKSMVLSVYSPVLLPALEDPETQEVAGRRRSQQRENEDSASSPSSHSWPSKHKADTCWVGEQALTWIKFWQIGLGIFTTNTVLVPNSDHKSCRELPKPFSKRGGRRSSKEFLKIAVEKKKTNWVIQHCVLPSQRTHMWASEYSRNAAFSQYNGLP
jgi:hypothetical protein